MNSYRTFVFFDFNSNFVFSLFFKNTQTESDAPEVSSEQPEEEEE